ncbi:restriction endonuclease subunit S [Streptomyces sp. NPDC021608]|uniref:restriction endonuclease subunit S n=1 Tax=Streptomyces sp. NPDC021608 TaxID=3154903 RepID=UPI0033EC214C
MSLDLNKSTWNRVTLGEVARHITDRVAPETSGLERFLAGEHIPSQDLRIREWGIIGEDPIGPMFYKRFQPSHVLYVSRRSYLRKTAVPDFSGITGEKTFVLESRDEDELLQSFLPFVLSAERFHQYAIKNSRGSVNPYLNWKELSQYEFILPSIDEQKRLANLLWTVERHRDSLFNLMNAEQEVASRLISHVRQYSAKQKVLADVASVRNGQPFPKNLQGRPVGDIPFFKIADLDGPGNDRFLTIPGNWIDEGDLRSLNASLLPAGTVVTARVGAAIRLERRRALKNPALVDDNHLVIQPTSIDPDFLLAVLSETSLAQNGNSGVVPSLNQKIVRSVKLPDIPPEEERIVGAKYRTVLDARDDTVSEANALSALRSSLISEIFGE